MVARRLARFGRYSSCHRGTRAMAGWSELPSSLHAVCDSVLPILIQVITFTGYRCGMNNSPFDNNDALASQLNVFSLLSRIASKTMYRWNGRVG